MRGGEEGSSEVTPALQTVEKRREERAGKMTKKDL